MKLDYDCIRSVLLYLEKTLAFDEDLKIQTVTLEEMFENLPKYDNADILYSVSKLNEAGYISAQLIFAGGGFVGGYVSDVTYSGHEFLEKVRDNKLWGNVKKTLSKLNTAGLSLIGETAGTLLSKQLEQIINI